MKLMTRFKLPSVWCLLLSFALVATPDATAAEKVFRAGAHAVDISPTNFPVIVNAMFTERSATNIVDRLHARALALEEGATRIVLCVVDTCMMPRDLIDQAKEIACKQTGIPPERMLVSATHTHSAPSAMGCLGSRVDPGYAAFLPGKIAEAIVGAVKNLSPARIGWTVMDDWEHTFNRRWIRRPDKILDDPFGNPTVRANMHPGHENPDAIGPSGPVDPGLSVLSVQSHDGRPLALLANYSQHYYGSPLLSADYYGRFAQHLATLMGATNSTPAFVGIMSQGTSGDLMWMNYGVPRKDIGYDAYAQAMAWNVLAACQKIQYRDWVPLKMAEHTLALNCRVPDTSRLAWARQVAASVAGRLPKTQPEIYALEAIHLYERPRAELKLQALRIGDLGITAIPNEVFAITGLKLKAQSPLQPTFNIELANGGEGYIPPPEQHKLGGYTTWPARTAGLEPQAEPRIVETMLGLLEKVSGQKRRKLADTHGPYARSVLDAKPLAYWRLNEFMPPTAFDATGHGHAASYDWERGVAFYLLGPGSSVGASSTPSFATSAFCGPNRINRAPHFAGGSLKAELKKLGANYSVMFWLWSGLDPKARATTGIAFTRGSEHLGVTGTNAEPGRLFFSVTADGAPLVGKTALRLKDWHHVTLVRESHRVAVFLDGEPELDGEVATAASGPTIFLGGRSENGFPFEGKLDEAAVFGRVLKPDEITRLCKAAGP